MEGGGYVRVGAWGCMRRWEARSYLRLELGSGRLLVLLIRHEEILFFLLDIDMSHAHDIIFVRLKALLVLDLLGRAAQGRGGEGMRRGGSQNREDDSNK